MKFSTNNQTIVGIDLCVFLHRSPVKLNQCMQPLDLLLLTTFSPFIRRLFFSSSELNFVDATHAYFTFFIICWINHANNEITWNKSASFYFPMRHRKKKRKRNSYDTFFDIFLHEPNCKQCDQTPSESIASFHFECATVACTCQGFGIHEFSLNKLNLVWIATVRILLAISSSMNIEYIRSSRFGFASNILSDIFSWFSF